MKFLCDNCKAKYQIADEKVAGKTVRMKCRKCGHQIEVRAAVTETSVSGLPPAPPVPQKSLATSFSATKPRAPQKEVGGGSSALAGAFQRTVQETPSNAPFPDAPSSSPLDLNVTNEWYVAINGVPVGPVRISELRRKAAAGAVTEDSLCWQEGLEEWRPVRSVPELAALVREAAQGNRPSLIAPPPEPAPPARPAMPPKPPARPAPMRPEGPMRSAGPPGSPQRNNVVPLRPAASLEGDVVTAPLGSAASALAPSLTPSPLVAPPAPLLAPTPTPIPTPVLDPFAVPPAPAPATSSVAPPAPLGYPPAQEMGQRKGVPLWFWPILLIALGFGGSVAFLVFRPPQQPQPVVIQMPATQAAPTQDKSEIPPPPASAETIPSATPGTPTKPGPVAAKNPTPATTEKKSGIDLGNLVPGAGGPSVGPGNTTSNAGGGLDQAAVEKVVANHRPGVKRTCWERGGADQKSSVNVTVVANVAPNGSVSSTSSSGDDPVVGKCIENQVKMWQFPAPGETKQLQLPFKFVRQ